MGAEVLALSLALVIEEGLPMATLDRVLDSIAAAARERGCYRLYWTTKEDNATARSLYDRIARFNGFIRYDYPLD